MDEQDWSGGLGEEDRWDDDEEVGLLSLDSDADGDEDADSDSEDADSEEEKELECIGEQLADALKQILSKLDPSSKQEVIASILQTAIPSSWTLLQTQYYKAFYYLLVSRNKATGVPLYSSSALYNAAPPQQQQLIQEGINAWDALSDQAIWASLKNELQGSPYMSGGNANSALSIDLLLSCQFARLVDNAEHTLNDQFSAAWGASGMLALSTQLAAQFDGANDLYEMAGFMSTYSVSSVSVNGGVPPFALGAQAVLVAYSIVLGLASAEALEKCLDDE